jgi:twitching motility protein PilU
MDFNALLEMMVSKKGSDLFITPGMPPCMKVAGRIAPVTKSRLSAEQSYQAVTSIMTERQRAQFEESFECNFAISAQGLGRFRVSAFYQRSQPAMVLRRIETEIPTIDELGLPNIIRELAMTKRGLCIFVGGTGTGKSTSLASMIGYRNENSTGHIITIEDPIEYMHPHNGCIVSQREVGMDTESFEVALQNTLRQAPDVILIGEIRTRETMEQAISFAETGHFCLATLHANNANQAMDRIVNFFPSEQHEQLFTDLSLNLKGILAQQLIATPDGAGRVAAIEVLLGSPLVSDKIAKGEVHELKEIMKRSGEIGMQTFDQHLYSLYKQGRITYEDALRHADSANEVRLMAKLQDTGANEKMNQAADSMSLLNDNERR